MQHKARLERTRIGLSASITLPLTRAVIADFLGLTIETVSRGLTELKRAGVIRIENRRRITVPSFAALIEETGDRGTWSAEFHGEVCLLS